MKKPGALLAVQVFLVLAAGTAVWSLWQDANYTWRAVAAEGSLPPAHRLPLAWHFGYKVAILAAVSGALVGSVRRVPWARWLIACVLLLAVGRLTIEVAVGFPDTPSQGPVPGIYYERHATQTERSAARIMYAAFVVGGCYLIYRVARGRDISQYLGDVGEGPDNDESQRTKPAQATELRR